jgi:hypothetical protein
MATEISKLFVTIGAKTEEFEKGIKGMSTQLKVIGAAMTAVGVAGLKMVSDARKLNAQLGQTGLTIGASAQEMRNLALATTDVTFPLESVTQTFELLAKAGVTNTEQMKASAKAFDALADATGSSAEVVADLLLPAFKLFGEEIPTTSAELDKFTWLTKNTLVNLDDFGTLLTRMAPYMDTLNMSMEDAIATLAALSEHGITGTAATLKLRTAITQAASSGEDLNTILGISQSEIDGYKQKMADASGITDKYAKVANEQYGIMDKIKQKFQELSLVAGSFLTPLEPILAAMTALGPIMIFISTQAGIAAVKWGLHTAAIIAHTIALGAQKIAMGLATAAQWAFNAAMDANPIGLIILAIAALIAAGILLYKNWDKVVSFFKGIPEALGNAFAKLGNILLAPFRAAVEGIEIAINWIIKQINKIKVDIPDWVPGLGGKTFGFNIPELKLPSFADWEGQIPGPEGKPYLAEVHGGEFISQKSQLGGFTVNINNPVVREDADIDRIVREIDRKWRLRGVYG